MSTPREQRTVHVRYFAACRYIIDELKQRLPIWKKEHYADGTADLDCPACGAGALPPALGRSAALEIDPESLAGGRLGDDRLIDIRERHEVGANPVGDLPHINILATGIDLERPPIPRDRPCLLMCSRGVRSLMAATALRERGWHNVQSLRGGLGALHRVTRSEIAPSDHPIRGG